MTADSEGKDSSQQNIVAYIKETTAKKNFLRSCSPAQIEQAIAKALAELGLSEGLALGVSINKMEFEGTAPGGEVRSHIELTVGVRTARDDSIPF